MIQLARNPVEGGSQVIRITFKDDSGKFYEPIGKSIFFSLYALREDNASWEIVNNRHKFQVYAESVLDVVLQGADLALLPLCTTKRRLIVDWSYMRNGEATFGRDMVDFEVVPLPTLTTEAAAPLPPISLPLFIKEIFDGPGSSLGLLFNDPVDSSTVHDGEASIYLGNSSGAVVSGVSVSWNADKTLAWLTPLVLDAHPIGGWYLFLSGNITSLSGSLLGASDSMNPSGYISFPAPLSISFKDREYEDGSWEKFDKQKHYYWDSRTGYLWYNGPGEGLIFRIISITQNGGAHFQLEGGSGIGTRDIWAWDGEFPLEGTLRHYYTKGLADNSYSPEDEVRTNSE